MKSENHKNLKMNKESYPDIINKKARNYARRLKWGKGLTEKIKEMLADALDKPCYWCGKKLTTDNIQLDHKNPMIRIFNVIDGIQNPTAKDLIRLNRSQNLRFICKTCNIIKGTLPEKEFKKLNDFLKKDKKLSRYVERALYFYNTRYSEFNKIF